MKNVILFSMVTFIMVIVWIGFSIYHNQTSTTVAPNISTLIDPIVARFDTKTLESLRTRKPVVVSLQQSIQIVGSVPLLSSQSAQILEPEEELPLLTSEDDASQSAVIVPETEL